MSSNLRSLSRDKGGVIGGFISMIVSTIVIILILFLFVLSAAVIKLFSGSDGLKVEESEEVGIVGTDKYFDSFSDLVELRVLIKQGKSFEVARTEVKLDA